MALQETPITDQFESLNTAYQIISDNDYRNLPKILLTMITEPPNENHDLSEPDWIREQRGSRAF